MQLKSERRRADIADPANTGGLHTSVSAYPKLPLTAEVSIACVAQTAAGGCMSTDRSILTIVVVASIAAAGCDGAIRVRGRVVDAAGAPISSARIHLAPARDGRRFDGSVTPEGCFTIRRVVAPGRYNYTVRITAPGFKPVQDLLPTNEDNRAIIVLQPMTELTQSSFAKSVGKWPESPLAASCLGTEAR